MNRRLLRYLNEFTTESVSRRVTDNLANRNLSKDGFLYDTELRPFADKFGFEGSASEWVRDQVRSTHQGNCALTAFVVPTKLRPRSTCGLHIFLSVSCC